MVSACFGDLRSFFTNFSTQFSPINPSFKEESGSPITRTSDTAAHDTDFRRFGSIRVARPPGRGAELGLSIDFVEKLYRPGSRSVDGLSEVSVDSVESVLLTGSATYERDRFDSIGKNNEGSHAGGGFARDEGVLNESRLIWRVMFSILGIIPL